jgi:hypothetical protein
VQNTRKAEFLTAGVLVGGVGHTYAVIINGEKLCVVNGSAVVLTYRPMREFAFGNLYLLGRFGPPSTDAVDSVIDVQ